MINNNINLAKIEVINDFEAQEEGLYIDPGTKKKINDRIDKFVIGLLETLMSTTLIESDKSLVIKLVSAKIYDEVLYLLDPRTKNNIYHSLFPESDKKKETPAKYTLKKPIVAVDSYEMYKDYFPQLTVSEPELYLAIETAMFVPTLLLNIIKRNNDMVSVQIYEFKKELEEKNRAIEQKKSYIHQVKTEKERFIDDLNIAIHYLLQHRIKLTQKNIYNQLDLPRQTFESRLRLHNISQDKNTKKFIDMDTNTPI